MSLILRPYQSELIARTRTLMSKGVRSVLLQAPTGSGKTALTAHMLSNAARKNKTSWFIVHRTELLEQSNIAFRKQGIFHGFVAAGFYEQPRASVHICSINTLVNRFKRLPRPDLIVWDECHRQAAASWAKVYEHFKDAYHIGLSATPVRLDGKGLGQFYQEMVSGPSVKWLIENGYLSQYKMFAPTNLNLNGVHKRMGDYVASELEAAVDRPTITGDAIREYKKRCFGKRAIVFAVSIKHSNHIVESFRRAGIPAEHVDGETPKFERQCAMKRFATGETKIISNVALFTEGLDLPLIESAILLRPTTSLGLYLQMIGRALRPADGKEYATILDHAGNCKMHGMPDEDRTWSLDGFTKESREKNGGPSVKVCPVCFAAQFSGKPVCGFCSHVFEIKSRLVDEVEGDLEEITKVKTPEETRRDQERDAKTLDVLYRLGVSRGYKNPRQWAFHVHQAKQRAKLKRGRA